MAIQDIEAHLREVYGVNASRELISKVTDVVTDEVELWRNRPVDEVYHADLLADQPLTQLQQLRRGGPERPNLAASLAPLATLQPQRHLQRGLFSDLGDG